MFSFKKQHKHAKLQNLPINTSNEGSIKSRYTRRTHIIFNMASTQYTVVILIIIVITISESKIACQS